MVLAVELRNFNSKFSNKFAQINWIQIVFFWLFLYSVGKYDLNTLVVNKAHIYFKYLVNSASFVPLL